MVWVLFAGLAVFVPVELVRVDVDLFDSDGPLGGWDVSAVERVACSVGEAGVVGGVAIVLGFPPYRGGLLLEEELMSEIRRRYDPEFKSGAVRIVLETGKPIARVARDLGLHPGTLGNWVKQQRVSQDGSGLLGEDSLAELVRLRNEVAELRTGA